MNNNWLEECHKIIKDLKNEPVEITLARLRKIGILDENNKLTKHYTDRDDLSITAVMEDMIKEDNE